MEPRARERGIHYELREANTTLSLETENEGPKNQTLAPPVTAQTTPEA